MDGETLEWVGESTVSRPAVLAFEEAVTQDRQAVTLRLDYPRFVYSRLPDGSYRAKQAERGEEFTLTPQLEWEDGALTSIRV